MGSRSYDSVASETIVVRPGEPGRVHVRVPYSLERLTAIKCFPDRRWLPAEKLWSLADAPDLVVRLQAAFPSDEIDSPLAPDAATPAADPIRRLRGIIRARHLSPRTEDADLGWIRRFLVRIPGRAPSEADFSRFLTDLVVESKVSASTQNQAFRGGKGVLSPADRINLDFGAGPA